MNPFTWDEKYLVGHPEIDADHRALLRMTEELYDQIKDGTAQDRLGGVLARLASYSKFHFETEESLMRRTAYRDYDQHRREHERFTTTMSHLTKRMEDIADDLLVFLGGWVDEHTCGADRRVMEHVKGPESPGSGTNASSIGA